MKTTGIFALASLLSSSLVVAVPFNKRDIVWVTKTAEVIETVAITTTVWVDAANYKAQPTGGQFYNNPHRSQRASSAPASTSIAAPTTSAAAPVTPSSSSVYVPPAAPSTPSSPSAPSAPSETSTSVVVAPVPTSTYVPPPPPASTEAPAAPSTTEVPPPAYTPPPASSAAPAPSATPPTSPPGGHEVYTGDITHYDVGLGSCGWTNSTDQAVVAIPIGMMANGGNPNHNPKCGQTITISYGGNEHIATIVDSCGGCKPTSIDLSNSLFYQVAPNGDGRVSDVNWWYNFEV